MATPMEELILVGKLREDVTVVGRKFSWHTLDSDEMIGVSAAGSMFDSRTREKAEKIETLARAIEAIDGVPFSSLLKQDEKDRGVTALMKAREVVSRWQPALLEHVHARYRSLVDRQEQAVQEAEKNGQSPRAST